MRSSYLLLGLISMTSLRFSSGQCSNDLAGVDNGDDICCEAQCGTCGGSGCRNRPGGTEGCCVGTIYDSGVMCSDSGAAPCIMEDDPTPTPEPTVCPPGSDMCDDPHMQGLRGQTIDWSGVDGGWYCLVTDNDANLHVNVRLTAPLPVEFPDRQLITGLSVISEGHSLAIEVTNPYSVNTYGCRPETRPRPETETRPRPETETRPRPKTETRPRPETETRPRPETETRPRPETETRPRPETETRPRPEMEARPRPETETRPRPETETRPRPETETRPRPETETRPRPEMETRPRPETETRPRPETETRSRPETRPCLADGGLRTIVDGKEVHGLLHSSRHEYVTDSIALSASNLPVECRQFGGDKIWARMYEQIQQGRRRLAAEERFEDWILRFDSMAAPDWCMQYIANHELADVQSNHAIFKIVTPDLTVRLNVGTNFQGNGELNWDGRPLPDLEFWQMDVGMHGLSIESDTLSGILGETARPVLDVDGLAVMKGDEAFRGTVEDYRVSGSLGTAFAFQNQN